MVEDRVKKQKFIKDKQKNKQKPHNIIKQRKAVLNNKNQTNIKPATVN